MLVRKYNEDITGITIDGFIDRHKDGSWKESLMLDYLPKFDPLDLLGIETTPI